MYPIPLDLPLAIRSIWVPLSRCTFFVEETIIDPCVALEAAESIESPCRPKTPLLFEARRPSEVNPPTAPVERVAVFRVPPAFTGTELAVFTTLPAVAPVVEVTPPINPPPPRADPDTAPVPPPEATRSSALPVSGSRRGLRNGQRLNRGVKRNLLPVFQHSVVEHDSELRL